MSHRPPVPVSVPAVWALLLHLMATAAAPQTPVIVQCDQTASAILEQLAQGPEPVFPSLGLGPLKILSTDDKNLSAASNGVAVVLSIKAARLVDVTDKQFRTLFNSLSERRAIGAYALKPLVQNDLNAKTVKGIVTIPWALLDAKTNKPIIEDRLVWPMVSTSVVGSLDKGVKQGMLHDGCRQGLQVLDLHVQEAVGRKVLSKLTTSKGDKKQEVTAEFSNHFSVRISGSVRVYLGNIAAAESFDLDPNAQKACKISLTAESSTPPVKGTKSSESRTPAQVRFEDVRVDGPPMRCFVRHQLRTSPEKAKTGSTDYPLYSEAGVSGDGEVVAVIQRNQVRLLNRQTGVTVKNLETGLNTGELKNLSVSPDGLLIAAAHSTQRLFVWDVKTGKLNDLAHLPQTKIDEVALLDNDRLVLHVAGGVYGLSVWPVAGGGQLFEINTRPDFQVAVNNGLRYSSYDRIEEQIGTTKARTLARLTVPDQPRDRYVSINQGGFSSGGNRVAVSFILRESVLGKGYSRGGETELGVWDVQSSKLLRHQSVEPREILEVALSPDGDTAVAVVIDSRLDRPSNSPRQALYFWDTNSDTPPNIQMIPDQPSSSTSSTPNKNGIRSLHFSADGKLLVACDRYSNSAYLWSIKQSPNETVP